MNCALPPPAEACSRAPPALEQTALDLTLRALRPLLADPDITELCINRPREAFIETRRGWRREELAFADFDWCRRLAKLVGNVTRQRVDESSPLLSAWLPSGERVQIILPPATTSGCVAITIRRPADVVWSIEELSSRGVFRGAAGGSAPQDTDAELLRLHAARDYPAFMRLAVRARKNILVSGATGSGKTTWTKALIREIPGDERLVTIEGGLRRWRSRDIPICAAAYSSRIRGLVRVTPKQLLGAVCGCGRTALPRNCVPKTDYRATQPVIPAPSPACATSAELAFEQLMLLVKQSAGGQGLARADIKSLLYLLIDVVIQCGLEQHQRVISEVWFDPTRKRRLGGPPRLAPRRARQGT
jgi:type IV secretion system protein VirB11